MQVQRKSFDLDAGHVAVGWREKSQYADPVFPTVLVQQLSVPFVHVQIPVVILEYDDGISTFVQIRQRR